MNSCVKCFLFLVVVAVVATYLMIYTSSGSTEALSNSFSIAALAKKDYIINKAHQHKERIKGVISEQYNAIIGDKSSEEDSDDPINNSLLGDKEGETQYATIAAQHNPVKPEPRQPEELLIKPLTTLTVTTTPEPIKPVLKDGGTPDTPLTSTSATSTRTPPDADPAPQEEGTPDFTTEPATSSPTTSPETTAPLTSSPTTAPSGDNNTVDEAPVEHSAVDTKALLEHIHTQCKKYGLSTQSPFDNSKVKAPGGVAKLMKKDIWPRMVIGSYSHKLMYSSNPKCGSTSFKKFLIRVHGDTRDYDQLSGVHAPKKHESSKAMMKLDEARIIKEQNLDSNTDKDLISTKLLEALQKDYYYVGFIRNPFTRLISGFRDKVLRRNRYKKDLIADIGHDNPTDQEKFYSFVKLIHQGKIKNLHFTQQYEKMKICSFPYDLLGQVETTDEQIPIMQSNTGLSDVEFPGSRSQTGQDSQSTQDTVNSFFADMPPDILEMFYELYRMDFALTGYTKLGDPNFPYIVLPSKQ